MRTITRADTIRLLKAAVHPHQGGMTIHLPGSDHGRFIVGGLGQSLRVPAEQALHPVTIGYMTERLNGLLSDFVRAETIGSWQNSDGTVYLDLGTTYDDRNTALHVAGQRGERAIYDSHDGTVEHVVQTFIGP